jgi:hypothetical protein
MNMVWAAEPAGRKWCTLRVTVCAEAETAAAAKAVRLSRDLKVIFMVSPVVKSGYLI